jgi:hypothetical protein
MMPSAADLISLDEAAKLIPGADADTLKRKARAGKLRVYRIGKAYSTTLPDLQEMVAACLVVPKDRVSISEARAAMRAGRSHAPAHGLSEKALSRAALDAALSKITRPAKRSRTT